MTPATTSSAIGTAGQVLRGSTRPTARAGLVGAGLAALLLGACTVPTNPPARSVSAEPSPSAVAPSEQASSPAPSVEPSSGSGQAATVSCSYPASGTPARAVQPPSAADVPATGTVTFTLKMAAGDVPIRMDRSAAPCTVHSFESLAGQGYFDGTACHRLTDSGFFVLQCGDPTGTGSGGPGYSFADELTGQEAYTAGVVAMANAGPNTNGSQFFLVYADSSAALGPNYTIFGTISRAGISTLTDIAAEGQDDSNPAGGGKPKADATITSVTRS